MVPETTAQVAYSLKAPRLENSFVMNNDQLTILFGSKTRVKLLRHFLKDPGQKYYVRELTRILADHINAIRHELGNLEAAGLVTKKKTQGKLYYRLDPNALRIAELSQLFDEPADLPIPPAPGSPPSYTAVTEPPSREESRLPRLGDVRLLVQNGKFVQSTGAPADLLLVGNIDDDLLASYVEGLEETYGEVRYALMTEQEYAYRRQLFDRFITLMLSEPKKIVINNLKDRQLARI